MDNKRDFRAEYEALLKQYEEDKKREQEAPKDFEAEYENEKREKRSKILSSIVLILFFAMTPTLLIGKLVLDPLTLLGIAFLFFGLIIFTMTLFNEPILAVSSLILFMVSAITTFFCGNPMMIFIVIPGVFAFSLLSTTIRNTKPLIKLLCKMKPLKKSCTEKVTAICIKPNERYKDDLIKEKIKVIPRSIAVVKLGFSFRYKIKKVSKLFCPVYELDYYGTKYTLCDNYYGISKTEEGESREILINPENPQEFYDVKRYRKDLWQILKTIPAIALIIMMTIFIGITVDIVSNYHFLLG
ncbi:MAG: hypothetical protein IKV85_01590 [Ruminococcus sp.]|nr:hypothetical protein [Ruminococcus sp.]